MSNIKVPYLCGGVLFFLLTKAALPDGTARDHRAGLKDEHSEPILMQDLIYTFTGSNLYGAPKDTSRFKDCLIEGSSNIPFNDIAKCTIYGNTVTENYNVALNRMDEFVEWHFDPEMKRWFVKAVLEIIENDRNILEDDEFFMIPDGSSVTKKEIQTMQDYDLSAFLVGVVHYILDKRRGQNSLGAATLDAIGEKKKRKPRVYTGKLGEAVTRSITVSYLPKREYTADASPVVEENVEGRSVSEKSDDEIIDEAIYRTGRAMVSALSSVQTPKVNAEGLASGLATLAAAAESCSPNEKQQENLVRGISTIATAFEAQKHAMAEEIRKNSRREETSSDSEDSAQGEESSADTPQENKKTIIQQQTNVIQNGDNNVNVTNNGTINFNF